MKEYKPRSIPKPTSWDHSSTCHTFKKSHVIVHVNPPFVDEPKGYEIFVGTFKYQGIEDSLEEAKMLGLMKARLLAQQSILWIDEELEKMTKDNPNLRAKVNFKAAKAGWDQIKI